MCVLCMSKNARGTSKGCSGDVISVLAVVVVDVAVVVLSCNLYTTSTYQRWLKDGMHREGGEGCLKRSCSKTVGRSRRSRRRTKNEE